MSQLDPAATTLGDICLAALKECGRVGVGQTALAEDTTDAWARLQWMLQQWERKRWLVYHLETLLCTSTGAQSYTVGPSGSFNTGASSVRPDQIESAFLRQLVQSQPNQIDYPLEKLQALEDYNAIALKSLVSFPGCFYYNPKWPLGEFLAYPVAQASIYAFGITVKAQLPFKFASFATQFVIPYEYYYAMVSNLAIRLYPKYGKLFAPGDPLPGLAKDALNVLRGANTQVARLRLPSELARAGIYNIFSDRSY